MVRGVLVCGVRLDIFAGLLVIIAFVRSVLFCGVRLDVLAGFLIVIALVRSALVPAAILAAARLQRLAQKLRGAVRVSGQVDRQAAFARLRVDRQHRRVGKGLQLGFAQAGAVERCAQRAPHAGVCQQGIVIIEAQIVQRRARGLHGVHRAADVRRVGVDARRAHERYVAGLEAGQGRVRPRKRHKRDMPDRAEEAAVPVLVGFERPAVIALDRPVGAGAVGKAAAVRRALPVDRDVEQAGEVHVGRGEHDAHRPVAHGLDRADLGQPVIIGRGLVRLRGLQAGDHVVRGQRFARPEGDALEQGEGKGGAVALIAFAQHVFRGEAVRHLKQALVKRLAQHAVDVRVVEHRVERAVLVPRQAEIRIRNLYVVHRLLLALLLRAAGGG